MRAYSLTLVGSFAVFAAGGGCGSGGSGGNGASASPVLGAPVAQADFATTLASVVCPLVAPCCAKSGTPYSQSDCQSLVIHDFPFDPIASLGGPGTTYDDVAAGHCVAASQTYASTCDPSDADRNAWMTACASVYGPKTCAHDDIGGTDPSGGDGDCNTTVTPAPAGASGDPCYGTEYILGAVAAFAPSNVTTTGGAPNGPAAGAKTCSLNNGLFCDATQFVCVGVLADGAACVVDTTWCAIASDCIGGVCTPRGGNGAPCTSGLSCADGLACAESTGTCIIPQPTGGACSDGEGCLSNVCSKGLCQSGLAFVGSACSTSVLFPGGDVSTGGASMGSDGAGGTSPGNSLGGSSSMGGNGGLAPNALMPGVPARGTLRSLRMRPTLFSFFDVPFPAYFTLLMSGFLFAIIMAALMARRIGEDPDVMVDLGLAMLLAGVVGSRLLSVVADGYFMDFVHLCTDPSKVDWHITQLECSSSSWAGIWDQNAGVCHPASADCFAWAKFWAGGLTYYGGFLGAVPMAWYLCKRDGFSFWKASDLAAFTIALGLGFGRMGCLLAGCCFGQRTDGPFGLSFPSHSDASKWQWKAGLLDSPARFSLPVQPTQIYESAASLAISAFCLLYVWPRKRYDGQVFVAFVILYAGVRFLLEFIRSDDRGGLWWLSTSQLIGVGLVAAVVAVHQVKMRGFSRPQLAS